MKRTALAIALLIAFATAPGASAWAQGAPMIPGANAAPPGEPQPKIQVIDPLYSFGTALEGEMVKHTFKFKNVGKGRLVIRGVRTSCGCTAATPTKSNLAPGEVGEVAVGFDTRFQKGHQVRTITLFTNDPANPQAAMTLQGDIKQQVAASPSEVNFGKVKRGTELTQAVVLNDLTGHKGFSVGPISNSNPAIKVVQLAAKDHQPAVTLKVSLLKTMPIGPFDDTIKVVTNRVPVQVDVFGTVEGDLNVDPLQVSFGIVQPGQGAVRILRLTNAGSKPIKLLGITSSSVSVTASAEPVRPGKEFRITVLLNRSTPDGQVRGALTIKTDDPTQQTLDVPFYGIVGQFKT